ncbi:MULTISPECIES: hypothetical protein [Idiomarina]|uniref:hypothetical protein n=1 Tax=Idiomarina TaxID=135575 RepID=UPI000C5230AE|nr:MULTISPECIES: hypothetical protein [Idiomarina]MBP57992.1 hypothetical protein [Idiomarina sp.]|tara:strand:+ start:4310 stop:6409 length:2100 start_codon:yes stop_codon:yes gene_type:complete
MGEKQRISEGAVFDLNDPLNDLKPKNLNSKRTRFILPSNPEKGLPMALLEIPKGWSDSVLFNLIMEYLCSPHFERLTPITKRNGVLQLKRFFNFAETVDPIYANDAALVYPRYTKYLKVSSKEKSAYKLFCEIRKVLRWAKDQDALGNTPKYWNKVTKSTLKRIADIPKPRASPKHTLSQKLNCNNVDDDQLFLSLRHYASYILRKSHNLREHIKGANPTLASAVEKEILSRGIMSKGLKFALRQFTFNHSEFKKGDGLVWKNLVKNHLHPMLLDSLKSLPDNVLYFFPRLALDKKFCGSMTARLFSERHLPTRGDISTAIDKENPNYAFAELFSPTPSEEIAMAYILATERIQPSGMEALTLEHCRHSDRSFQICDYDKNRSGRGFDSPLYKSNTPIYKSYSDWYKMAIWLRDNEIGPRSQYFLHNRPSRMMHQLKLLSGVNLDWYAPLLFEGEPREIALEECPESSCFLEVMLGKLGNQINNGIRIKTTASFDSVAYSRVFFESRAIPGVSPQISQEILTSFSAHSLKTNTNIYKDRTESNIVVRAGIKFSADVADAMEGMANSAQALLDRTTVVSLDEIEKQLGYVRGSKDFSEELTLLLDKADVMGYEVGLTAEISNNKNTYVICTPLVAGLIQGEIAHIENSLPRLENENSTRCKVHKTRLLYLELVIEQFDSKIVSEGRDLLKKYDFPYPPLS